MRGLAALCAAFVAVLLLANSAGAGLRTTAGGNPAKPAPPGQEKKADENSAQSSQPGQEHVPPGQAKKSDEIAGQESPAGKSAKNDAEPAPASVTEQQDEHGRSAEGGPSAQSKQKHKQAVPHPANNAEPKKQTHGGNAAVAHVHVIICHRTGSESNPYVVINISMSAWLRGHSTHPDLDGRSDILLKTGAAPGEKMPRSACGQPNKPSDPPKKPDPPRVGDPGSPNSPSAPTGSSAGPSAGGPTAVPPSTQGTKGARGGNDSGVAAQLGSSAVSAKLPFTGLPLWIVGLGGLVLLAAGFALLAAAKSEAALLEERAEDF